MRFIAVTWFHDAVDLRRALAEVRPEVVAVAVEDFVHGGVGQGHGRHVTMVQGDLTIGHEVLQQLARHLDTRSKKNLVIQRCPDRGGSRRTVHLSVTSSFLLCDEHNNICTYHVLRCHFNYL